LLIRDLVNTFHSWNSRNRAPATVAFYRARLKKFCQAYNTRELESLTPLEIDEHLAQAGTGMRDIAGLPKDLVLYLARHECGTKICREKGIEYARRLLGHTNISTTQRYMHLDDQELADAQDLID
jgi:site-specific recombinase XerD